MTIRKYWIGSTGPFLYDDSIDVMDPYGTITEKQSGLVVDGTIKILAAPVAPEDGLRLSDLETSFSTIAVTNIDDPSTELNAAEGSVYGNLILCHQISAGVDQCTLYVWDNSSNIAENVPYTVDGLSGQWVAIAGKYSSIGYLYSLIRGMTATRIPFANSNGYLTEKSTLTFTTGTDTLATTNISATKVQVDYIDLNLSATVANSEGRFWWNDTDKTVNIGLAGSSSILQVGQEMQLPRAKATGSNILNGQVVYISGASGSKPEVSLAKADSFATSDKTIAVATENVNQNSNGYFTAFGLVRDIDTSGFSAGDALYLSATTAGALTKTAPTEPNNMILIGYCIHSDATTGIIFVHINKCTIPYSCIYGMTSTYVPYAGSNGFLNQKSTFTFNPSTDALVVGGQIKGGSGYFGGATHYSEFESDGTLKFNGNATVFKDLIADAGRLTRLGSSDPSLVKVTDNGSGSIGLYLPAFIDGSIKELQATFELQHDYKEGTDLVVHLHWFPSTADTGNIDFEYEYVIHKSATVLGNSTKSNIQVASSGTTKRATRTDLVTISGSGVKVGDQIIVRFSRDARVTNANDTFVGDVYIQTLGIHYECDTVGSRQITTK